MIINGSDGEKLDNWLKENAITKTAFAKACGISKSGISKALRVKKFTAGRLVKLREGFDFYELGNPFENYYQAVQESPAITILREQLALKDEVIKSQQQQIEFLQKLIDKS